LLHSNRKSDVPVTEACLNAINGERNQFDLEGRMLEKLKWQWLALSDEQQQNFGVLFAIPAAILFGLLMIWLLPNLRGIGWEYYRLTATVEVDGQTLTTSQVYGIKCNNVSTRFPQAGCLIRGEAMPVDLGRHGRAFFVMNQWNVDHSDLAGADYMIVRLKLTANHGGIPKWNNLPAFVRFRDVNNPVTAEFIDPRDLEAPYGKGVGLTQFTVTQVGGMETTNVIKTILPWVKDRHINALGEQGAAAKLHTFDFKWPQN
jgi:hypothetical protein